MAKRKRYGVFFLLADEKRPSLRSEWDDKKSAILDFLDMVDGIIQTDDLRSYDLVYVLDRLHPSKTAARVDICKIRN